MLTGAAPADRLLVIVSIALQRRLGSLDEIFLFPLQAPIGGQQSRRGIDFHLEDVLRNCECLASQGP